MTSEAGLRKQVFRNYEIGLVRGNRFSIIKKLALLRGDKGLRNYKIGLVFVKRRLAHETFAAFNVTGSIPII